jgi:hypothetical protein
VLEFWVIVFFDMQFTVTLYLHVFVVLFNARELAQPNDGRYRYHVGFCTSHNLTIVEQV